MRGRRKKRGWKRVWWEVRYQLACLGLRVLLLFTHLFPLRWALFLVDKIGWRIGWPLAGKYKRKMLDNLTLSFQDSVTPQEKRRISQESLRHMIRGFVEFLYCISYYREKFDPMIELEGSENLQRALALGRGVIAISGHLGNFILLGAKLNASGFPFAIIVKEPDHPGLAKFFRWARKKIGARAIHLDPPFRSQKEILRSLRKGEIVCFFCDQHQKRGGVPVHFLGRVMAMPAGPAIYYLKTRAPILPIFIVRQDDAGHKVIMGSPFKVELSGDEERDIFAITTQISQVMDSYIRRYPGQWPWISKRRIRTKTRRKTFLERGTDQPQRG